jgi:hypothetical protein
MSGLLPTLLGASRIRLPPASTGLLRQPAGEGLSPPLESAAPRGAPRPRTTGPRQRAAAGERRRRTGREPLHPPVHRHVVDLDATLGQQFVDVSTGEAVAQLPADRDRDHLRREPKPANADRSARGWTARGRRIHGDTHTDNRGPSASADNSHRDVVLPSRDRRHTGRCSPSVPTWVTNGFGQLTPRPFARRGR